MSFAVLFVNVLTLTFSIYSGTTLADEKTFTTFFSDNFSSTQTDDQRRNAAISQNPAIDGADRFTGGCLGGLNYWGDFNSSMNWRYRIQSNELWAAGNSISDQNVPNTFIGPDYSFGSNLGITTITEEGGTRTYRLSFDVRNPSSSWAGIQLGLSASQRGNYLTDSPGLGLILKPSGEFQLFDNSSSPKLTGSYTYQATNHVVVEYETAGFTSANKATVNVYVDGAQIISNYVTTTGLTDNYFQLISRSTGNRSLVVYYDNLVVESTANTVLDVSNPSISLSREWQMNGLDKQGIKFLTNRGDSSEAEHTGNLVLSNNGGFINVASGLTLLQSGGITGQYTLTKTGAGTLQINAAQNAVDVESLVISSGRLDMKEYFKGDLEINNTATFSPGNSIGTLYQTGDFTLDEGATLWLEVGKGDTILTDVLNVTGDTIFEDGSIIKIALDSSYDNAFEDGEQVDIQLPTGIKGGDGNDLDMDNLVFQSSMFDLVGYNPGTGYLSVVYSEPAAGVPEPSTWALLLLGAAGLLYVRKRTRK